MAEGLVAAGTVAIDGTKIEANGPAWSNRTRRQIADEILAEADRVDAEEDAKFGERRGDELPESWVASGDRRSRLREALRQVDERGALDWESYQAERTAKEAALGRKLPGRKPGPRSAKGKDRQANTTDPDSRMLRARNRFLQGYNGQVAVSEDQVIVASVVHRGRRRVALVTSWSQSRRYGPSRAVMTSGLGGAGASESRAGWTGQR